MLGGGGGGGGGRVGWSGCRSSSGGTCSILGADVSGSSGGKLKLTCAGGLRGEARLLRHRLFTTATLDASHGLTAVQTDACETDASAAEGPRDNAAWLPPGTRQSNSVPPLYYHHARPPRDAGFALVWSLRPSVATLHKGQATAAEAASDGACSMFKSMLLPYANTWLKTSRKV